MATENHSENAQALVGDLRAMRQKIPNFVFPTVKGERRRLTNAASVPAELIELTAVAMKNNAALVRGQSAGPEGLRDLLSYADAYAPLADELEGTGLLRPPQRRVRAEQGGKRSAHHLRADAAPGQAAGDGRPGAAGRCDRPCPRTPRPEGESLAGSGARNPAAGRNAGTAREEVIAVP